MPSPNTVLELKDHHILLENAFCIKNSKVIINIYKALKKDSFCLIFISYLQFCQCLLSIFLPYTSQRTP